MTPIAEIGTVSTMFAMQLGGTIIMFIGYYCHKSTGSMLAERFNLNMRNFVLWGTLLNLIMINYLPVLVSTFISVVGMQWETDTNAALASNIWTLLMLHIWLICPPLMFVVLYRHRNEIGQFKKGVKEDEELLK